MTFLDDHVVWEIQALACQFFFSFNICSFPFSYCTWRVVSFILVTRATNTTPPSPTHNTHHFSVHYPPAPLTPFVYISYLLHFIYHGITSRFSVPHFSRFVLRLSFILVYIVSYSPPTISCSYSNIFFYFIVIIIICERNLRNVLARGLPTLYPRSWRV